MASRLAQDTSDLSLIEQVVARKSQQTSGILDLWQHLGSVRPAHVRVERPGDRTASGHASRCEARRPLTLLLCRAMPPTESHVTEDELP